MKAEIFPVQKGTEWIINLIPETREDDEGLNEFVKQLKRDKPDGFICSAEIGYTYNNGRIIIWDNNSTRCVTNPKLYRIGTV